MLFKFFALLLTFLFPFLLSGCGTYSTLRPGDNLKSGRGEFSGGIALSSLPEGEFVFQGNLGVWDWLELGAQYEGQNLLGWAKFGLLSTERNGFALSILADSAPAR